MKVSKVELLIRSKSLVCPSEKSNRQTFSVAFKIRECVFMEEKVTGEFSGSVLNVNIVQQVKI